MRSTVDDLNDRFSDDLTFASRLPMNRSDNYSGLICPPGSDLDEPYVKAILISVFVLLFLLCFFGNLLVLIVILCNSTMRTVTNFFLANLAVADLFVGIFCVMQHTVFLHILEAIWPFGDFMCRTYLFTLNFAPCASSGILLLVSIERYIAVLHPVKAKDVLTKGRLALMTAAVWLISFLSSVPYFLAAKVHDFGEGVYSCGRDKQVLDYRGLVIESFVLWYVAALTVMSVMYTRIGQVLWQSANLGIAANRPGKTNPRGQYKEVSRQPPKTLRLMAEECDSDAPNIPLTNTGAKAVSFKDDTKTEDNRKPNKKTLKKSNSDADAIEARKKVVRLLVTVVVTFALLILPHHIRQLWGVFRPDNVAVCVNRGFIAFLQPISYLLEFLNSAIDPLLYAFMSGRFRTAIKQLLRCRNQREQRRMKYLSSVKTTETSDFATTELSPTENKSFVK